jgi:DNA-binding CsgD family transcriptional regulator
MPALAETYRQQLGRFDVTDVIDLMFWADGVPVAGVGVLKRRSDPAASGATLAAAGAMQRYMEFSLQTHSRLRRARRERVLGQTHGLTAREVAVSELVLQGLTNGEIAKALNMRLPTVKSHLMQVFGKTGCGNRTRLAAILNQLG